MNFFRTKSKVKSALEVISQERHALTTGDTDALVEVINKKERIFREIFKVREKLQESELRHLATSCSDVQKLYASAQAGMRSAQQRVQSLRQLGSGLSTYNVTEKNNGAPIILQEKIA
ncbi:hypothetical protein BCF46_2988 [Litoreibacter meonggei]|uniref:FlgN protein n=1 Tax=Litoreibacter meonggei TaxID=1049199 RepID=A0A497VCK3_9RHOB|nr:hypothetical protein [Litoreibacter meonggei]RLJ41200.1 hypothetical protein BCF46_2988 [Litoreibacter meonggei]